MRIIKEMDFKNDVAFQDIKVQNIDEQTLDFIYSKVGSYEALFSKRAMKFKSMGLNKLNLTEDDYKKYMLSEYTFLKRPFIIIDDDVFIGNSPKTIAQAKKRYQQK
jgi:arsenate reductase